jgi:hypothetical protein
MLVLVGFDQIESSSNRSPSIDWGQDQDSSTFRFPPKPVRIRFLFGWDERYHRFLSDSRRIDPVILLCVPTKRIYTIPLFISYTTTSR